nr:hypothetical protein [Tanacetum cinerariifolium]
MVEDYQREFKKLMNRVTDIPKSLLISFYISGLKLNLQCELLVSKPTTLGDAFSLACITKARLEDQSAPAPVTTAKPFSNVRNQRQSTPSLGGTSPAVSTPKSPSLPNPNTNPKPHAVKWISPTERQERLNKGLCFNCDNRWVQGHKCPCRFLLLITDKDDDPGEVATDEGDDAVESGDISILNSLFGHGSPRNASLRMKKISLHQMEALLDLDEVYAVYEIHSLANAANAKETRPGDVALKNPELTPLIERFDLLFQEHQFYVKHSKHVFRAETLKYLAHIILGDGLRMDPKKIKVVREWHEPTTQRQEVSAFEELKQQLSTGLVLSLSDFNKTKVDDWEFKGLFGVLLVDNVKEQRWDVK